MKTLAEYLDKTWALCAARTALVVVLGTVVLAVPVVAQETPGNSRQPEPNTLVPGGTIHHAPTGFPDRIVASPAQDAAQAFAVAWRTDASVREPLLEVAVATDSPDLGVPRRITASTRPLRTENGLAHHHRADIAGLQPDTLYAWRVQGDRTWSPWAHLRTAATSAQPLTLLYFGDTQNKNASLGTRLVRQAQRGAPEARLALYAGDLVNGGDGEDDNEWAEWFEAGNGFGGEIAVAPAAGNHEYYKENEGTPLVRRRLGPHWPLGFALPGNGAPGMVGTTYWFDYQGVRVLVFDGTSALELGTAAAQAAWADSVLADKPQPWTIAVVHQAMYSPREGRNPAALRQHLLPVLQRHRVDLVLQGHDHVYARRAASDAADTPVLVVSVAGAKQYLVSDTARRSMRPVAEDLQLYQVIRVDGDRLHYQSRTVTGRLMDAFELYSGPGGKRLVEHEHGRIGEPRCPRAKTLKGRSDRCWE